MRNRAYFSVRLLVFKVPKKHCHLSEGFNTLLLCQISLPTSFSDKILGLFTKPFSAAHQFFCTGSWATSGTGVQIMHGIYKTKKKRNNLLVLTFFPLHSSHCFFQSEGGHPAQLVYVSLTSGKRWTNSCFCSKWSCLWMNNSACVWAGVTHAGFVTEWQELCRTKKEKKNLFKYHTLVLLIKKCFDGLAFFSPL